MWWFRPNILSILVLIEIRIMVKTRLNYYYVSHINLVKAILSKVEFLVVVGWWWFRPNILSILVLIEIRIRIKIRL